MDPTIKDSRIDWNLSDSNSEQKETAPVALLDRKHDIESNLPPSEFSPYASTTIKATSHVVSKKEFKYYKGN